MSNQQQQQQRKKYDMQQAHIMKGTLHGKNQQPSKDHVLLFKALEDLDRAECMVPRSRPPPPPLDSEKPVSSHQQQLEKARDLYREAIGTLLGYVNDVTGKNRSSTNNSRNSSSSRRNSSDTTAGSDPNLGIEIDVLKERIKLALTHAEEIQEILRVQQLMSQRNSNHHDKGPDDKQDSIKRRTLLQRLQQGSKSENMHHTGLWSKNKNTRGDCSSGSPLVTCASADDTVLTTKRKPPQRRSNLNYNSNDPFIEIVKKDLYIDSKSIHTTWKDISGLQNAKQALQEAAILPLLRPDLYTGLRSAPRGVLLYGPPGTGKTMLVRAVAHESQCILFACSASAMTSKWVGEAEKLVRTLFRMAADVAPSIIFLDEMDALLGRRRSGEGGGGGGGNSEQESSRRFKTEFMIQMDGLAAGSGSDGGDGGGGGKTLLIGCTNCPWDVDDAVMRRFQRRIYVPLPDKAARRTLWQNLMDKSKGSVEIRSNRDLTRLVELTQGFSCSDIASIANEAAFGPLRDLGSIEAVKGVSVQDVRPIQMKDFEEAIRNAKKSVSVALLNKYDEWESAQAASAVKI